MNDRDSVLETRDDDRLPWLEAVEDIEKPDHVSTGKVLALSLAGLLALGAVVGGVALMYTAPAPTGDGKVIAAAPGNYKVKADTPGGMKVEGQGDSAFAASEGAEAAGRIDTNAMAEAPVVAAKSPPAPAAPPVAPPVAAPAVKADVPATGGRLTPAAPARPVVAPPANLPAGSTVQLGAYNSEALANGAWTTMTRRFAYLGDLQKSVEMAQVKGRTVYRLRASAPGRAAEVCGKLKVAGENCLIVN